MIILKSYPALSQPKAHVSTEGDQIVLVTSDDKVFCFDPKLVPDRPDMMFLMRDNWGELTFVWMSEVAKAKAGFHGSLVRKGIFSPTNALAVFAVTESGQAHALVLTDANCDEQFASLDGDLHKPLTEHFADFVPELSGLVRRSRARQQAIARLDEHAAIAALEAQVDLLTKALAALIEQGKAPDWWAKLTEAVEEQGAAFDTEAALRRVLEEKTRARQVEVNYRQELKSIQ